MADPFSFASGALGILGNCVDYFQYVQMGRHFGRDYQTNQLMLDTAKTRLSRWGTAVKAEIPDFAKISPETKEQIQEILEQTELLFKSAQKTSKRYETKVRSESRLDDLAVYDPISDLDGVFAGVHTKMKDLAIRRQKTTSLRRKATWALYDKRSFDQLVTQIVEFTRELETLLPVSGARTELLKSELAEFNDEPSLRVLHDAASETDENLAGAAQQKLEMMSSNQVESLKMVEAGQARVGDYHSEAAIAQGSGRIRGASNKVGTADVGGNARLVVGNKFGGRDPDA